MAFFAGMRVWGWEGQCLWQSGQHFRGPDDGVSHTAPHTEPGDRIEMLQTPRKKGSAVLGSWARSPG